MIKFKVLKYKHYQEARRLSADPETTDDQVLTFVIGLVESWDFTDQETDQALKVDPDSMGDLALEQYNELMGEFNSKMGTGQEVPKPNAGS